MEKLLPASVRHCERVQVTNQLQNVNAVWKIDFQQRINILNIITVNVNANWMAVTVLSILRCFFNFSWNVSQLVINPNLYVCRNEVGVSFFLHSTCRASRCWHTFNIARMEQEFVAEVLSTARVPIIVFVESIVHAFRLFKANLNVSNVLLDVKRQQQRQINQWLNVFLECHSKEQRFPAMHLQTMCLRRCHIQRGEMGNRFIWICCQIVLHKQITNMLCLVSLNGIYGCSLVSLSQFSFLSPENFEEKWEMNSGWRYLRGFELTRFWLIDQLRRGSSDLSRIESSYLPINVNTNWFSSEHSHRTKAINFFMFDRSKFDQLMDSNEKKREETPATKPYTHTHKRTVASMRTDTQTLPTTKWNIKEIINHNTKWHSLSASV